MPIYPYTSIKKYPVPSIGCPFDTQPCLAFVRGGIGAVVFLTPHMLESIGIRLETIPPLYTKNKDLLQAPEAWQLCQSLGSGHSPCWRLTRPDCETPH